MLHSELGHIEQHYLPHFLASFVEMLFGLYLTEITLALFSTQLPGHGSTVSCICGCYSAIFGCVIFRLIFNNFRWFWPFSKINFQPNLEAYCCVTVSAKKFRQAKKRCLTRIVNFFPKNILPSFQKWCSQNTQTTIGMQKIAQKSHPLFMRRPQSIPIFRKMTFFG